MPGVLPDIKLLRRRFLDAAAALLEAESKLEPGARQTEAIRRLPNGVMLCAEAFLAELDRPGTEGASRGT